MQEIGKDDGLELRRNRAAQLRKMGLIISLVGLLVAALIYAFVPDSIPPDDNSLQNQYYKQHELQVQRLWGAQGSLVLGITRLFQRASTWSVIVIVLSAVVAFICFYLASHPRGHQESTNGSGR